MKFIKALIIAMILTVTTTMANAGYNFSEKQIQNMQKAYHFGNSKQKKYNGTQIDFGYIMAAILWQESSCGVNIKNGHAVGAFQNYIPTVRSRMKQQGIHKTNAQISNELSNFNTSAHWSNIEIDYWLKTHKGNMPKTLASYNAGYNVGAGQKYSNQILKKAAYLRSNNVLKVE